MGVVTDYTSLLGGNYWNGIEATGQPIVVTFSFPTVAPAYDATVSGFSAGTTATFSPFTAAEQAQAIAALGQWASASGLVFVEVAPGKGDINFQNVDFSTTSYGGAGGVAFYPFGDWNFFSYPSFSGDLTASGDVFMNSQFQNDDGTVNFGTLLHEIGHAIGLKHPTETVTDFAANPVVTHDQVLSSDDPSRTIMATVGDGVGGAASIKQLDRDAAAFLYGPAGKGAVYESSANDVNSVSSWSWDATNQTLTQTAVTVGETIHGTSVDDVIYGSSGDDHLFGLSGDNHIYAGAGDDSLYDGPGTNHLEGGAGNDNYYVSNSATVIVENLNEGSDTVYATASYVLPDNLENLYLFGQGLTGQGNNQGNNIYGDGTYGTTLIGGTGGDYIVGGAGDDTIRTGGGGDVAYGQGGADTFVFAAASESPAEGARTAIADFSSAQGDKIDISAIPATGGQPLTYINQSAFTHVAGQVREDIGTFETTLEGDVNGDGVADFAIRLANSPNVQASDLILCFCSGTRIATPNGEVAVEDLSVGDWVLTADGAAVPLLWIGRSTVSARFANPLRSWPIRIKAGALGDNLPRRDLLLSPDHALLIDDVLIHAGALINGTSIVREKTVPETFVYYHVELDRHSLIWAENVLAETFVDNVDRMNFDNWGEHEALFPEGKPIEEMTYPRAKSRRQVPMRVRAALDRRAYEIGAAASATAA